jgi:hypothetical protein
MTRSIDPAETTVIAASKAIEKDLVMSDPLGGR